MKGFGRYKGYSLIYTVLAMEVKTVMNKNKIQKVNRALVASTLAISSAAIVIPPSNVAEAASFKDLPTTSSHYNNIQKLVAQKVFNGYPDGTFRPNQSVTRGQAAKAIANALKLDTTKVTNPHFKDVPTTHPYYKYIAAIANKGIISGYATDNTFRPNQPLTRGQMSKILVNGYKFEQVSKVGNIFKDVNGNTSHALAIQTLYNLKITIGTTPVTFSPAKHVTRGQFASFLVRSEEAKLKTQDAYKITSILDETVYINNIPYKIADSLQPIINKENEEVLKGATIVGRIQSNTIYSISQLTLNASGTKYNMLEFEGDYETFAANIIINGKYIRFQNFELTGTVTVTESVRKTLDNYSSRFPKALMASLDNSFSFINWTTTPNAMTGVEKYIEFENTTVNKLVIGFDKTKIVSDTELNNVSIVANVNEVELQSDINKMVVNTDVPVTIYGDGDIERVEYNSLTDLNLYTSGYITTLVVDNTFGWVDLGVDTDVYDVILPKGTTPNDAFADYLVDFTNITKIEDPSGNTVDKNPIENQKPIDKTPPVISGLVVTSLNDGQAKVDFSLNEGGNYYYMFKEKGQVEPSLKEIVQGPGAANRSGRSFAGSNSFTATGLKEKTEYVLYLVAVDANSNVSLMSEKTFTMKDSLPPTATIANATPLHGGQRVQLDITGSEAAEVYYWVRPDSSGLPTRDDVLRYATADGTVSNLNDNLALSVIKKGLSALTDYQVFVVLKDESGNYSDIQTKIFKTLALDNIAPYVKDAALVPKQGSANQFYIYFNEKLDKLTAENPANYTLSGSGIINVEGQDPISPELVKYEESGSNYSVLLTIPSLTGFVNNDTLNVTVSEKVKDLADNEFENINTPNLTVQVPRNIAKYRHLDTDLSPKLSINSAVISPDGKTAVTEFNTTKAGTYYYVVMKSGLNTSTWFPLNIVEKTLSAILPDEIITYGGGNPLAYGTQKEDISIQGIFNPFYSYSMYVVLRDRSGYYSNIVEQVLVKDATAPEILSPKVVPQPGDTIAHFKFNADEKGNMHYIIKKKGEVAPTLDEVKSGTGSSMQELNENKIDLIKLTPKTEYVLYYIAKDTVGNWQLTGGVEKVNEIPFYSDGTKPEILNDNILYRVAENTVDYYDITFNEAIDVTGFDEDTDLTITGATLDTATWLDSNTKLRLKFNEKIESDVTVTVNAGSITDTIPNPDPINPIYQVNKIGLNENALYKYRLLIASLSEIILSEIEAGTGNGTPYNAQGHLLDSVITSSILSDNMTYSFIVWETEEDTIDAERVLKPSDFSLSPIAQGSGTFNATTSGRIKVQIRAEDDSVFIEDDWMYVVVQDKYGNISEVNKFSIPGN